MAINVSVQYNGGLLPTLLGGNGDVPEGELQLHSGVQGHPPDRIGGHPQSPPREVRRTGQGSSGRKGVD